MAFEQAGWASEAFTEENRGKLAVFFHTESKRDNYQSTLQNRPVFVEETRITKLVPGDTTLVVTREIRTTEQEDDRVNYPVEWQRFLQKKEAVAPGTPIDLWPELKGNQVAELKALHITTIDQLAGLSDGQGQKIMGFNDLRKKARAFLSAASEASMLTQIRGEMEKAMAEKDTQISELTAMVKKLLESQGAGSTVKRGRGRPPKNRAA